MRPFILTAALGLASCSSTVPIARLDEAPSASPPAAEAVPLGDTGPARECDAPPDASELAGLDDRLAMLTGSIRLAQVHDAECGTPPAAVRQCRALFLLGATEPVRLWAEGAGGAKIAESVSVWRYASAEGLASSSPEMVESWRVLSRFAEAIGGALAASDDDRIAVLLIERGKVADDLEVLEEFCAL